MKPRNAILAGAAVLALFMTSCNTLRRAGKDAFVGVASPGLILYGGATDGAASAAGWRYGMGAGSALEVLAFPFTFTWNAIIHTGYCAIHIIDLPLCLLYWPAELYPGGPEIKPLDFYQGTIFDKPADSSTDPESGQSVPPNYDR